MKISLSITTYNRFDLTIKSCAQVLNDPRIDDLVILDDASTDGSYQKLVEHFKPYPHVRVMQQVKNQGMSLNKYRAIREAWNPWVIILDSDNIIGPDYIDAVYSQHFNPNEHKTIYSPSWAAPSFDFRKYEGMTINSITVKRFMHDPMFRCFLNCCNYLVHAPTYCMVYKVDPTVAQADTIAFNYQWLAAGGNFVILPACTYQHLVHEQSGFMLNADFNMKKAKEYENKIMAL